LFIVHFAIVPSSVLFLICFIFLFDSFYFYNHSQLFFVFVSNIFPPFLHCSRTEIMSTVAGLRLTIRRFLAREITFNNLSNVVRSDGKRSLPVTSLSLADVQKVLGLNLILDDEFDHIPPVPLPSGLGMFAQWIIQRNQLTSTRTLVRKV
jgi:hypothetical protein